MKIKFFLLLIILSFFSLRAGVQYCFPQDTDNAPLFGEVERVDIEKAELLIKAYKDADRNIYSFITVHITPYTKISREGQTINYDQLKSGEYVAITTGDKVQIFCKEPVIRCKAEEITIIKSAAP